MNPPREEGPDLEAVRRAAETILAGEKNVVGLYFFGSRERDEAFPDSDIDLAVLFGEPEGWQTLVDLEERLRDALGWKVDLVDLGQARAFLALDVIRGERVYCTDEDRCDEFDLYVLRRAGDLAPFEWERRRMLLGFDPRQAAGEAKS